MKKSLFFKVMVLLFLAGIVMSCKPRQIIQFDTGTDIKIIPRPASLDIREGRFILTPETHVELDGDYNQVMPVAGYFADMIKRAAGWSLSFSGSGEPVEHNTLRIKLDEELTDLGPEGYVLSVRPDLLSLSAASPAGLFYGVQTIRQLLPPAIESAVPVKDPPPWTVPCVDIRDKPRFAWRGLMLDVSRHFFPKEFIYRFIDYLAMHKLNTFHWHLTDDQGWRIEIKKYPLLTQVGAWRVDRENQPWNVREKQKPGEKATYGGFYTQEEIKDIVAYAQSRFVTIIPEIEMPAHTTAALAAYPQYSCTGGPFTVLPGGVWPITDIYCAGKDETFTFLEDILTEIMDLFPGPYIHIGGDEADKKEWRTCPLCQARIKAEGLKDEEELQSYFIKRIEKFIISHGRRLIGWDEILQGGLAPEATVMSWRGTQGGIEAAQQGHDVIMSPTSNCYFDYYQGSPDDEPTAIGGFLPLSRVYAFDPIPAELSAEEARHILGAQANLWTEYISTPEHAEYMLFPRAAALAEVAWTPQEEREWKDFAFRIGRQFARYQIADIHFAESAFHVNIRPVYIPQIADVSLELRTDLPQLAIRYTLNGKRPSSNSNAYSDPVTVQKTGILKAASFIEKNRISPIKEKKVRIHKAAGKDIQLTYPYGKRYSGGGDHALTDGLEGTLNRRDGLWQGFQQDDLEAVIDLGSPTPIKRITTHYLQDTGSWIFLPTEVEYAVSDDGQNFKVAARIENRTSLQGKKLIIKKFTKKLNGVKARFIKVRAKNIGLCPDEHPGAGGKAWLLVDEIIVE